MANMIFQKHAGIFAAGHGTRLQSAYPGIIKPMVPVNGTPLIGWAVKLLASAGAEEMVILLNSSGKPAREYLKSAFPKIKFIFILKDTATSYESFRLVSQMLAQKSENFLLSAVDSLYAPEKLRNFINSAQQSKASAVLGITDRIEDEKPLWTDINTRGRITAMGPDSQQKKFATSGIYFMTAGLAEEMPEPANYTALRQYLTELIQRGRHIDSVLIEQSVDIDDPQDIISAENFIKQHLAGSASGA